MAPGTDSTGIGLPRRVDGVKDYERSARKVNAGRVETGGSFRRDYGKSVFIAARIFVCAFSIGPGRIAPAACLCPPPSKFPAIRETSI